MLLYYYSLYDEQDRIVGFRNMFALITIIRDYISRLNGGVRDYISRFIRKNDKTNAIFNNINPDIFFKRKEK